MILMGELCQGILEIPSPLASLPIADIAVDSRKVNPGSLFVAIRGFQKDGLEFAREAVRAGAVAIVAERDPGDFSVPVIVTKNPRRVLALLSHRFFGAPTETMLTIGVTGTNGKTTVSYLIESILNTAGFETGLVGTICYRWKSNERDAQRTTPESVDLYRLLKEMAEAGVCAVVMEVSSHALALERVTGIRFQAGIFTNLTRDHLDFHGDIETYAQTKAKLFSMLKPQGVGIVNADDPWASLFQVPPDARCVTYGRKNEVDYRITSVSMERGLTQIELAHMTQNYQFLTPLWGEFNVSNVTAAAVTCMELGIDLNSIREGILHMKRVPGRMEGIESRRGYRVVIDYAHTPDALANVLQAVRGFTQNQIWVVFGCGGERDQGKRPIMGEIASQLADWVVLTSDNPRGENPKTILGKILEGVTDRNRVMVMEDRREAIRFALNQAKPGDTIVLAGKGHETYQEIGGQRIPFSEREIVENYLIEKGEM